MKLKKNHCCCFGCSQKSCHMNCPACFFFAWERFYRLSYLCSALSQPGFGLGVYCLSSESFVRWGAESLFWKEDYDKCVTAFLQSWSNKSHTYSAVSKTMSMIVCWRMLAESSSRTGFCLESAHSSHHQSIGWAFCTHCHWPVPRVSVGILACLQPAGWSSRLVPSCLCDWKL